MHWSTQEIISEAASVQVELYKMLFSTCSILAICRSYPYQYIWHLILKHPVKILAEMHFPRYPKNLYRRSLTWQSFQWSPWDAWHSPLSPPPGKPSAGAHHWIPRYGHQGEVGTPQMLLATCLLHPHLYQSSISKVSPGADDTSPTPPATCFPHLQLELPSISKNQPGEIDKSQNASCHLSPTSTPVKVIN